MTACGSRPRRPDWLAQRLHGLRRLLKRRLRVKRVGISLHIVLDAADAPTAGNIQARPHEQVDLTPPGSAELACMRADLAQLLDVHPVARSLFPSLVLVERALGRNKSRALDRLPDEVLADASTLLAKLAGDWSADGLAMLRTRLRLLRSAQGDLLRAAQAGGSLQAEEGSLTMFMEADREWDRQLGRFPPAAVGGGVHQKL